MRGGTRNLGALALLGLVAGAGCRTTSKPEIAEGTFLESEYEPFDRTGRATIEGRCFLMAQSGQAVSPKKGIVHLDPATTYSKPWFEKAIVEGIARSRFQRGFRHTSPGRAAEPYSREAEADETGAFTFKGLPAGDYFLTCGTWWNVPAPPLRITWDLDFQTVGGIAYARVRVCDDEQLNVHVTRPGESFEDPYFK